ncbi:DUF6198 family protein [Lachnospiraceae bacterium 62-35]
MKRDLKEYILRLLLLFIGLVIAHLGVTLFLLTDLGADPFNVFVQGIFRTLKHLISPLTHGYVHAAVCIMIMLVLLFADKSYIKTGTLICMLFGGPIIDVFTRLLEQLIHPGNPFIIRLLTLALGCIILAFGMTIVIKSEAGTGPNDLVAIALSDKLSKPFGRTRIIVDLCFVAVGFLMGGAVGIGTIISAFLVGPVAGIFLPLSERLVHFLLNKATGRYS